MTKENNRQLVNIELDLPTSLSGWEKMLVGGEVVDGDRAREFIGAVVKGIRKGTDEGSIWLGKQKAKLQISKKGGEVIVKNKEGVEIVGNFKILPESIFIDNSLITSRFCDSFERAILLGEERVVDRANQILPKLLLLSAGGSRVMFDRSLVAMMEDGNIDLIGRRS